MKKLRSYLKTLLYFMLTKSLREAAKAHRFNTLIAELEAIVPDITDQYSSRKVNGPYLKQKVRNMHVFQIGLVNKVLGEFEHPFIIDVGDSAGTHVRYIRDIYETGKRAKFLSVNLDDKAVDKIQRRGLDAIKMRAEDLPKHNLKADILLCFELLEHLSDPVKFLHELSGMDVKYLIATVPYLRKSRIGLHHIRRGGEVIANAENTHIFELSPGDWKLIARHAGWNAVKEDVYLQYPKIGFWRLAQPVWKRFDFEGFYGVILKKDKSWSQKYKDW